MDRIKNRFIISPDEGVINDIGKYFSSRDAIVIIDSSDVEEIVSGAENTIVLVGKATGCNRCADAIEDAVLHTCSIAEDYNLFSATKMILYIYCPKDASLLVSEHRAIIPFVQMFHQDIQFKWGLAEKTDINEMMVVIVASNLQKKN